jgi:hypothetical protein
LAVSNFALSNFAESLEPPVVLLGQAVNIKANASSKNHRFFIVDLLSKT